MLGWHHSRWIAAIAVVGGLALAPGGGALAARQGQDAVRVDDSDDHEHVTVPVGGRLNVRLTSNESTGFSWRLVEGGGGVLKALDNGVYRAGNARQPGAGGHSVFKFDGARAGE